MRFTVVLLGPSSIGLGDGIDDKESCDQAANQGCEKYLFIALGYFGILDGWVGLLAHSASILADVSIKARQA